MNILLAISVSTILITGCEQKNNTNNKHSSQKNDSVILTQSDTIKPKIKLNSRDKYFPFELLEIDGHYQIIVQIEGPELYPTYYNLFKKYGYEGNGYCWEGHITQILEKLDRELLKHIEFDPEAGSFFAKADIKANQIKFVEVLSPIFSDIAKLELWVKKADRLRIDD